MNTVVGLAIIVIAGLVELASASRTGTAAQRRAG